MASIASATRGPREFRWVHNKPAHELSIPSLLQLCNRVLQNSIDELTSVGDVPDALLPGFLRPATGAQLMRIENATSRSLDTDGLWRSVCFREGVASSDADLHSIKGVRTWKQFYVAKTKLDQEKSKSILDRLTKKHKVEKEEKDSKRIGVLANPPPPKRTKLAAPTNKHSNNGVSSLMAQTIRDFRAVPNVRAAVVNRNHTIAHNTAAVNPTAAIRGRLAKR